MTVSDDATLRVWDIAARKQIHLEKLNVDKSGKEMAPDSATKELSNAAKGRSIDIDPSGKYAAIGMRDGSMRLY